MSFLRWERGTDWNSYYLIFKNGGLSDWSEHTELGYKYFNQYIRDITDNYTVYLFLQSLIYYGFLSNTINGFNKYLQKHELGYNTYYSVPLLFLYSQDFAGLFQSRSIIAYIICLNSIIDLANGKNKSFFVKVLISYFIHRSSLLFLLVYPMYKYFKFKKKWIFTFGLFSFLFFSVGNYYGDLLNSLSFDDYTHYLSNSRERNFGFGFIKWLFILVVLVLYKQKVNKKFYETLLCCFSLGFEIYIWSQLYTPVAQRIGALFMNVVLLSIVYIFNNKKNLKLLMSIVLFCFSAASLLALLNGEYAKLYVPFKFVWDTFPVETF